MELLDIGKELKDARERQGLSLEKVYEDTRIGTGFLQSLEQGKVENLSHPVYARGFVRSYARYLGLDSERITEDFSGLFKAEHHFDKFNPDDIPISLKTSMQSLGSPNYAMILAIILVIAVVLGLGWFLYSSYSSRMTGHEHDPAYYDPEPEFQMPDPATPFVPERPKGLPADDETFPVDLDSEKNAEPEADPEIKVESALPAESPPDHEALESLVRDDAIEDGTPETGAGEVSEDQPVLNHKTRAQTEDEVMPATGLTTLVIQARDDCWTRVVADESRRDVYLRPGESASYEFEDFARITLGNAGGVDIFLNGEPYPFEASSGEVKTFTVYPPDNDSN